MTTQELIDKLKEVDPTLELTVVYDDYGAKIPIDFVRTEQARIGVDKKAGEWIYQNVVVIEQTVQD